MRGVPPLGRHLSPHISSPHLEQPELQGHLGSGMPPASRQGHWEVPLREEVPHQDYKPMASRHDRQGPDQGYIGATLTKPSSGKLKQNQPRILQKAELECPQEEQVPRSPSSPSFPNVHDPCLGKPNPTWRQPWLGLMSHLRVAAPGLTLMASVRPRIQAQAA